MAMAVRRRNLAKFVNNLMGNVEPETTQSVLSDIFERSRVIADPERLADTDCVLCLNPLGCAGETAVEGLASGAEDLGDGAGETAVEGLASGAGGSDARGLEVIRLPRCEGHYFHRQCVYDLFSNTNFRKCPICSHQYMPAFGNQPANGRMTWKESPMQLAGYSCPTIVIQFEMPSGVLPAYSVPDGDGGSVTVPEQRYSGASRVAYLPKNADGEIMLKYLVRAFRYRWIFRVGTSLTSGQKNCVCWGDVPIKTATTGGFAAHGYPDTTYMGRLIEMCQYKGIFID
jgi:hypothetical protein